MRPLTVLSVAYPFAPVGPDAIGGAEQILARVEAGLVAAGCRSLVVACPGSQVRGSLHAGAPVPAVIDDGSRRQAWDAHRSGIAALVAAARVDVVHLHGVDFAHYLPPADVPTVATLHLPLAWYPPDVLALRGPRFELACVSHRQRALGGAAFADLPVVENGVPVPDGPVRRKRRFAVALSRVCPEKGLHLALDAAKRADVPLLIGGRVFPYPSHEAYFRDEIAPRLDRARRFAGPVVGRRKRGLLETAQCLLVPSLVDETSSLVALEALAAGTPVVARPAGALVDVVEHGRTGFLCDTAAEMADAIRRCATLDPEACRASARARWPVEQMIGGYLAFYHRVREGAVPQRAAAAACG